MKHRPTIRDVARKTSLSVSTVSLVLNNKAHVSEETRRRVQKAIDELGYHPQRRARGLASKSSGNIGFILTDDHFSQAEPFYTKIFLGTEFEARKHNYYVLLTTVGRTLKETKDVPRFFLEQNVDGVVIAGKIAPSWIDYIRERNLPLILIDYELPSRSVSCVVIDNVAGARVALEHLRTCGHTKVGFIGGDIEHPSIAERYHSYREVLSSDGMEFRESWISIDEPDTRVRNGYNAANRLFLSGGQRPSAVFAANDAMAIGSMQCLKESGLKIPSDVAVVGFDNIEASIHVEPRLTTVNVHKEEMGALAVRRLVEMIKDDSAVVTKNLTPVELVVRESCGVRQKQLILNEAVS